MNFYGVVWTVLIFLMFVLSDTEHNEFVESVCYQGLNNFLNQDENQLDFYDEYADEYDAEENRVLTQFAENQRMYELLSFFNSNNEWNIHFHALA